MIEVEIKLPLSNQITLEDIEHTLEAHGFSFSSRIKETDTYFDNAAGDIRSSGQAFRLRMEEDLISGKKKGLVTFKGKRLDKETVTRPEYETEVSDPQNMHMILSSLGYQEAIPIVCKKRTQLTAPVHVGSTNTYMTACLDHVNGLGDFLELEILVETEDQKPSALEEIEKVLALLDLSLKDTIQTSYLSLLQKRSNSTERR